MFIQRFLTRGASFQRADMLEAHEGKGAAFSSGALCHTIIVTMSFIKPQRSF